MLQDTVPVNPDSFVTFAPVISCIIMGFSCTIAIVALLVAIYHYNKNFRHQMVQNIVYTPLSDKDIWSAWHLIDNNIKWYNTDLLYPEIISLFLLVILEPPPYHPEYSFRLQSIEEYFSWPLVPQSSVWFYIILPFYKFLYCFKLCSYSSFYLFKCPFNFSICLRMTWMSANMFHSILMEETDKFM